MHERTVVTLCWDGWTHQPLIHEFPRMLHILSFLKVWHDPRLAQSTACTLSDRDLVLRQCSIVVKEPVLSRTVPQVIPNTSQVRVSAITTELYQRANYNPPISPWDARKINPLHFALKVVSLVQILPYSLEHPRVVAIAAKTIHLRVLHNQRRCAAKPVAVAQIYDVARGVRINTIRHAC